MKTHTLRGRVQEGTIKRLIVDDGRLTHAMRITKFVVAGDPNFSGDDVYAVLGCQGTFPIIWDWSDNNQIAWSSTNTQGQAGVQAPFSLTDKDHLIIRDLYITGQVGAGGGSSFFNYYIEMEAVDISHDESILQLIKERSQGDLIV
jgi:hypothetical protein